MASNRARKSKRWEHRKQHCTRKASDIDASLNHLADALDDLSYRLNRTWALDADFERVLFRMENQVLRLEERVQKMLEESSQACGEGA